MLRISDFRGREIRQLIDARRLQEKTPVGRTGHPKVIAGSRAQRARAGRAARRSGVTWTWSLLFEEKVPTWHRNHSPHWRSHLYLRTTRLRPQGGHLLSVCFLSSLHRMSRGEPLSGKKKWRARIGLRPKRTIRNLPARDCSQAFRTESSPACPLSSARVTHTFAGPSGSSEVCC